VSLPLFDPSLFVSMRALAVSVSPAFKILVARPSSVHAPLVTVVVPSDVVVELRVRNTSITVPFAPLEEPEMEVLPATIGDVIVGIGDVAAVTVTEEDATEIDFPDAVALAVTTSLGCNSEEETVFVHALLETVVVPTDTPST